ncbi:Bug family tripartite tricarboxylate transporter substrate binding protein [Cupriavidus necator]
MIRRNLLKLCAIVPCCLIAVSGALAQDPVFPSKPVRVIVPFTAGGSPDLLARTVGQKLTEMWGQPVVVENYPGAGGAVGARMVARAPADGYTWLVAPNSVLVFAPLIGPVPYDAQKDFVPIGMGISVQNLLVVNPSLPVHNVPELLALAKSRPNELTYASGGAGSPQNFSLELLKGMTGKSIRHIPYKGSQAALTDLLGGRVDVFLSQANSLIPMIKAGKLRLLAGTGAKRYQSFPNVPAVAETVPGYSVDIWSGFVAPKGTPATVIEKANADLRKVLAMKDVQAVFEAQGVEAHPSSPQEMATIIRNDTARWAKVVKEANIKAE